jgi:subtilase family serine protease
MVAPHLGAQSVAPRITSDTNYSEQATIQGSLHPMAQAQFDDGRMPAETRLNGVSIFFGRSAEQEADLQELIAAQQDPASPLYHQWLNPDQFAARFGMADSDLDKVKSWLEQQGFSIDSVARSRNMIRFSGTARQVEQAFLTEMHYYNVQGALHFAPSTELSVPAAFASAVMSVRNLNDFRPRPMHIAPSVRPDFTSSQTAAVHFAPGDIKVAYNIPSSYTGKGQSIALMGQSAILTTDIENFESASGLSIKDPTLVLVPSSGISKFYEGDESESDIDVEWSGGIATGANIVFVYVGNNLNYGVFDSVHYAIDENIAPIISISYGSCETALDSSDKTTMEAWGAQAVAQGQTIVASSGDSGSTSCEGYTGTTDGGQTFTTAMDQALAVNYPASSAYVTAAGGTEITAANDAVGTYWGAYSSTTTTTALQWIPEVAWNDDTLSGAYSSSNGGGLSSSGGGVSALIARPSWQTGTIGGVSIPTGNWRLVPDIALYSSPNYPGYLFCSSDPSNDIDGSCSNGFRDANDKYLTVAGGTSFAAPIFAGMVAIINQAKGYTSGQGLVNPTLYTLATNSSTYASAFHDVTSGNNYCTAGTTYGYCSATGATEGYAAGTGYDEVTGLGSVNLTNLITAWTPPPTPVIPTLVGTTTTISAVTLAPSSGVADTFTITVVSANGVTPLGNVTLVIDGGGTSYSDGGSTTTVALTASGTPGTATAQKALTFSTTGTHQVIAQYLQYPGNTTFAFSTASIQVVVGGTSSGVGSFTIGASPSTLTVSQGGSGNETITITPAGGYTGTVWMNYNTSNNTALANLNVCADYVNSEGYATLQIVGTAAQTTTFTFDTNASEVTCQAASPVGGKPLHRLGATKTASKNGTNPAPFTVAFAGLLLAGFLGRRSRKFLTMAGAIVLLVVALTISSCGGGSSNNTTNSNPPAGTYTITITGMDSVTSSITAQTSFTLVIQ